MQWLSRVPASLYRLLIIISFRCRYQWMPRDARSEPDREAHCPYGEVGGLLLAPAAGCSVGTQHACGLRAIHGCVEMLALLCSTGAVALRFPRRVRQLAGTCHRCSEPRTSGFLDTRLQRRLAMHRRHGLPLLSVSIDLHIPRRSAHGLGNADRCYPRSQVPWTDGQVSRHDGCPYPVHQPVQLVAFAFASRRHHPALRYHGSRSSSLSSRYGCT